MFETFGNLVTIKESLETDELELSNKTGEIYGETTPSITEVEVIGDLMADYAINVYFDDLNESFWFAPGLLEPIELDDDFEVEMSIENTTWIKTKEGWSEPQFKGPNKAWWKFW